MGRNKAFKLSPYSRIIASRKLSVCVFAGEQLALRAHIDIISVAVLRMNSAAGSIERIAFTVLLISSILQAAVRIFGLTQRTNISMRPFLVFILNPVFICIVPVLKIELFVFLLQLCKNILIRLIKAVGYKLSPLLFFRVISLLGISVLHVELAVHLAACGVFGMLHLGTVHHSCLCKIVYYAAVIIAGIIHAYNIELSVGRESDHLIFYVKDTFGIFNIVHKEISGIDFLVSAVEVATRDSAFRSRLCF